MRPPAAPALGAAVENDNFTTTPLPFLLTIDETAVLLRLSRKAVYAMVERHQLPGVARIGTRIRVRSRDLLQLLESADQKPTPSSRRSGR